MIGNTIILFVGLAVYAGYGVAGLWYLLAATILSYWIGRLIPRFPWITWVSVAVQGLLLAAVKLQPAVDMEFLSVLGISYFTLKILSYHLDLYQGKYRPEKSLLRYGLYVTYLPQLFLGPIERYGDFLAALENRRISWDGISLGGARALRGLFKKLVVATRAGVIVAAVSADPQTYGGAYALAAMVLYYLQLYADFSGGIDMVIGISQMLGIRVSENFRLPYLAESVQEFWHRWHITLGSWLRDYVYIPLGGSRRGQLRKGINTLLTFLVSGLWHGVHYLVWGLLNGIFVLIGGRCKTKSKLLNRFGTFVVISFLWAFFVWPDTVTALRMIASVFTAFRCREFLDGIMTLGLNAGEWAVLICGTAAMWIYDLHQEAADRFCSKQNPAGRVAVICGFVLVILVFGMYGIGFDVDAFIYSRF